jgi:phosphoribosylaminoimidazole-succinocarboxamide synthase
MLVDRTELPLPLVARGKVRDVYAVGADRLLIVATDRISAFDVVLPQPIPHKGTVLTQLTAWWLARMSDLTPNHLVTVDAGEIVRAVPALAATREVWARRSMLVRRARVVPVECVVRGYLAGSAWAEYRRAGTLAGEPLAPGLRESERLQPPVFSPATKADTGHDENISYEQMQHDVGAELAGEVGR